jgi:hypothetical protein
VQAGSPERHFGGLGALSLAAADASAAPRDKMAGLPHPVSELFEGAAGVGLALLLSGL